MSIADYAEYRQPSCPSYLVVNFQAFLTENFLGIQSSKKGTAKGTYLADGVGQCPSIEKRELFM